MTTKELYRSIGVSGYEHQQCWRKDGGNIKGYQVSRGHTSLLFGFLKFQRISKKAVLRIHCNDILRGQNGQVVCSRNVARADFQIG